MRLIVFYRMSPNSNEKGYTVQMLKTTWEQTTVSIEDSRINVGSRKVNKQSMISIDMETSMNTGAVLEIYIEFEGYMFNDTTEGLFRNSYIDPETKQKKW